MKRITLVLLLLLLLPISFMLPAKTGSKATDSPDVDNKIRHDFQLKMINDNMILLKNNKKKTRPETFKLVQPIIAIYLSDYVDNYIISDSLSFAIACIFVSESSTSKGHSARSSLWLKHNNPFGLTTTYNSKNSISFESWEEIKGVRTVKHRTFKTFNSLDDAVQSLMTDYLLNGRYDSLQDKKTVNDFLIGLYECGYMTGSYWPKFATEQIYLKSI